ncbi:MAG: PQQ-binding-like beta-propeller repeat protein [Verrucomicrobiales bacterium]|nr:PQQ-binding-like beta-propeller repeat protein [Verrucomicrobiales bacterium]
MPVHLQPSGTTAGQRPRARSALDDSAPSFMVGGMRWTVLPILVSLTMGAGSVRADWPAARGNAGRTGTTDAVLPARLTEAWTLTTPPPAPAWTGEARGSLWQKIPTPLTPRAADDLAPVPVLARGLVIFGTTHDDVRAVELATGRTRWRHYSGAPIRFAPAVVDGRVFVGSDDGTVSALDLETGAPVWSVRIGPERPWIAGNGRLISPCPIRTGLSVSQGVVYVAAGLFPIEGAYLAALDAASGSVRWRRHLESLSPQGYLAETASEIVVPFGRASPKLFRKRDGTFLRDVPSASGTVAVVAGDETMAGPGATGRLVGGDSRTGARLVSYPGLAMAVTEKTAYLVNGLEILALDRQSLRRNKGDESGSLRWRADCIAGSAVIVAGHRVYAGSRDRVEVFDAESGTSVQTLSMPGPVAALAADSMGLVAMTRDGVLRAFLGSGALSPRPAEPDPVTPKAPDREASAAAEWTRQLPSRRGLTLWTGTGDPVPGVLALTAASEHHLVVAVPPPRVEGLRQAFAKRGLLGSRVSVVAQNDGGSVPVADHLFNLVIADGLPEAEAIRAACPAPSGFLVRGSTLIPAPPDPAAGTWTHQYGTAANLCASRQPLTGHPHLRWFGGHGPERMPDRHTRGHAPLAAGGILLSMAENALIATDARNGVVRWVVELPDSMRYAMPYDAGYAALRDDGSRAFVAVDEALWSVDTRTGTVVVRTPVPLGGLHWGWVALDGDAILGSAESPEAPRTEKNFDLVDLEYRSGRPLVCSQGIFRLPNAEGSGGWVQSPRGRMVNPTLCAGGGRVYAVEARGPSARTNRSGRLTCTQILEDTVVRCFDATTGSPVWEKPLHWPEARDVLGMSLIGNRLLLSAAQSVGEQANYRLRCWSADDGNEHWSVDVTNPVKDLYHGQQVKRPVVLRDKVAFESALFDLATGRRWSPPGAPSDWILSRPGHACGGMTGGPDGLLFRADNPTFFRFSDGTFTRLSPTRPGCWLNILPVEGGVLIPEASASCICEYPIQASLGFAFSPESAPVLPDVVPPHP